MAKRRPRWWLRILSIVVVLGLLAGAAEFALRQLLPPVIATAVRTPLGMPGDQPVDVRLGGSALLYALQGGVGDVTISVPKAPLFEGLVADAKLHADKIPFNPLSGEIDGAVIKLSVSKDELPAIVRLATQDVAQTGEVRGGELVVGRTIESFGQQLAITASLALQVVDGAVEIEPRSVSAAGFDLSVDQLSEATGSQLDPILKPQTVCVRDHLPRGVTLTNIVLAADGSATLYAKLDPKIISDPQQRELGSCS